MLLVSVAVLLGATLQAATGFGFALVAAPLMAAVLGPRSAISAIVVLAVVITVLMLVAERRRPQIEAKEAIALVAWATPGLLAGAIVLRLVPERPASAGRRSSSIFSGAASLRPRCATRSPSSSSRAARSARASSH